ncbi:MAG: TlyA family RNA methyltransferase [Chloroflexi bacterium]|nr:TlyA family RNA methyltransferase [Chloroflexota bacterium]MCY3587635.1 TlyA family RNA methyltransferase [Chloroflexota bacterium]MCY3686416.1 TlyA family RNA methyltransferase [Chloroflexota bacterium]MDE2708140.1 TlyA family RNA methyltransferase [Chloroflexota bacterium]
MSRAAAPVSSRRVRVDELLVQRGDAQDLTSARALVMSGRVHGAGRRYTQAGLQIPGDTELRVKATREYASRGGEKLVAPLDEWPIQVRDRICLDVGASTGGFTDVLLRRGAERVYAVDAGYGQLAESLRQDPRVESLERTHICELPTISDSPSLATVDVSFIGLQQVLPCVAEAVSAQTDVVALVKPQFEAPSTDVDERGVVRDRLVQGRALSSVVSWAVEHHWRIGGVLKSPLAGPAGNCEWFVWLRTP